MRLLLAFGGNEFDGWVLMSFNEHGDLGIAAEPTVCLVAPYRSAIQQWKLRCWQLG